VRYGNMLLVPIDNALLYVQPFYVVAEDQTRQLPRLQRVIVAFGDQVVIENTLSEALTELFGERAVTQEDPGADPEDPVDGEAPPDEPDDPGTPSGTNAERAATLLDEANTLFADADAALADGDLATYEENIEEGRAKVDEAIDLLEGDEPAADDEADDATTTTEAETTST
jgi:hypothetical protein